MVSLEAGRVFLCLLLLSLTKLSCSEGSKSLILGTCPEDFVKEADLKSCYKVFTPDVKNPVTMTYAMNVTQSQEHCRSLHPRGGLVSINTLEEKDFLSNLLKEEEQMLAGWQGWWTSGTYDAWLNMFKWTEGTNIVLDPSLWGFKKRPFPDTCVWVLQIPVYNQTVGNYECLTKSGHICEVELPSK